MKLISLIGERFGRWVVIAREGNTKRGQPTWQCRCDCGVEKVVIGLALKRGSSTSCGCYRREWASRNGLTSRRTHGHAGNKSGNESPEYRAWAQAKSRCHNENHQSYDDYGGRGIQMCERWRESFEAFLEDVGRRPSPKHSLDRHPDNDGHYEPGNVRWATSKEQNRNKRATRLVTADGQTKPLAEWLEVVGMSKATFYRLLRRGRSDAEALGFAH